MPRFPLDRVHVAVSGLGTVRLDWTTDYATGVTVYRASAPRVAGSFTVVTEHSPYESTVDVDTPRVRVVYGRGDLHAVYGDRHADRPVINSVQLTGASVVDTTTLRAHRVDGAWTPGRRLSDRDVHASRSTGPYTSQSAPQATQRRTAAIIEALLSHWLTRPDNLALRVACARRRAQELARDLHRTISQQRDAIAAAHAAIAEAADTEAGLAPLLAAPLPAE